MGAALWIVGCLAASLASTHERPEASTSDDKEASLDIFKCPAGGAKLPLVENHGSIFLYGYSCISITLPASLY